MRESSLRRQNRRWRWRGCSRLLASLLAHVRRAVPPPARAASSALDGEAAADCWRRFSGTPRPCRPWKQTLQTIYAVQQVWRSPGKGEEVGGVGGVWAWPWRSGDDLELDTWGWRTWGIILISDNSIEKKKKKKSFNIRCALMASGVVVWFH